MGFSIDFGGPPFMETPTSHDPIHGFSAACGPCGRPWATCSGHPSKSGTWVQSATRVLSEASTAEIPAEAATRCAGRVDSSANLPARKRSSAGLRYSIWVRQTMRDPKKSTPDHFPHGNCLINWEFTIRPNHVTMTSMTMSFGNSAPAAWWFPTPPVQLAHAHRTRG